MTPKPPPGPKCPKCAANNGQWTGPTFRPAHNVTIADRSDPGLTKTHTERVAETLEWACPVCGFVRLSAPVDAGGQPHAA